MRRLVTIVLMAILCLPAAAATRDLGQGFADHGVATPISCHRGLVATAGAGARPVLLAWLMDHRGAYELLLVDVEAGKCEEHPVDFPLGDAPFASILASNGRFYSHFGSHFVEFDPHRRAFTFCRKTAPQMAMSMTEDQHGAIWSATYPASGLVSFDPRSREFNDYGHLYKQDWAQYPRSAATDDAGWVYLGIGNTAFQILAFEPRTGRTVPLVPEDERGHGMATVFSAVDGKVYGRAHAGRSDNWLMLHQGRAVQIGKAPSAAPRKIIAGSQGLFHGVFPDGRRIKRFDLVDRMFVVEDPKARSEKSIRLDYQSEGAHIMAVAAAPDGAICGGTAFPMRFFRYDPQRDAWINRAAFGQWNTVGRQGDRFFIGAYAGGHLLEWNPAEPWVDTIEGKPCNPRVLARCSPTIIRPARLLPHPDGRTIVVGGTPAYGLTGGGLLVWDRLTAQHALLTHEQLLPQHATMSLVALHDGKLLGGTTTAPGTGGQRKANQAELYLFDLTARQVEWHEATLPGVQSYTDMCLGPDGLVWGIADRNVFFVFDPAKRRLVHQQPIPRELAAAASSQGPRVFVRGPKQEVYVLGVRGIARIEPAAWKFKVLAKSPAPIAAGGDLLDGRIYFAAGSHVYSYRIP